MKKYHWYDTSTASFGGTLAAFGFMTLMTILMLAAMLLA